MLTKLKTIDDLKQYINITLSAFNKSDDEIDVHWFVAMFEARQLNELSLKDIASVLLEGTKKIDDEYVVEWLESFYSDVPELEDELKEYIDEEGDPNQPIVSHICHMYNIELDDE